MRTGCSLTTVAVALLAGVCSAADPATEFTLLLDLLEKSKSSIERGFDQMAHDSKNPGQRVVQLLGSPQTWDPYGTPALRQAVLARWRKRWASEGAAMLRGSRPPEFS